MAVNGTMVPFASFGPDVSDLNGSVTSSIENVLPRSDGYGPFPGHVSFTSALAGACRGYFFARNEDQLVVFAATETRIYLLDNTTLTWSDVSSGGSAYAALSANENWQFAQFNNFVIAVQANVAPQVYNLSSDTDFDDLGGSPPQARYISIINRFVVLSGLLDDPYRVQWSGLNDTTNWTAGTGLSDFQDLPDGGVVRGVVGGEFGIIIQDGAMRRMIFSPGSDVIFQIDRISKDTGALAPYSIVNAGERVFFLSPRGFIMTDSSGAVTPIGKERIDRTFLSTYDSTALGLVIGVADPASNLVMWSYRSQDGGDEGLFDKLICFDWVLNRWSTVNMSGEYIAALARPGQTLEGLDSIGAIDISGAADNGAGLIRLTVSSTTGWTTGDSKTISAVVGTTEANGTWLITVVDGTHIDLQGSTFANAYVSGGIVGGSIDELSFSLDTVAASTLAQLSMFNPSHELGFFNGDNLVATLETAEIADHGWRTVVNGFFVVSDADEISGQIGQRSRLVGAATYSTLNAMQDDGFCPVLAEGRYVRGKIVIAEGDTWSFATGLVPDAARAGRW
jgi:hypothetical protein